MSSWRNHRVIIVSLFLPTTAVLGESPPASPDHQAEEAALTQNFKLGDTPRSPLPQRPGPLKSIVEDLKSRTATPAITPPAESLNPFSNLFAQATASKPTTRTSSPQPVLPTGALPPRLPRRTLTDHHIPHRIQRKHSRSSSTRRQDSESHFSQQWHVEFNPHCNGGLKNAVNSVDDKVKKQLWVGVLGANTDNWRELLKKNVERRMKEEQDSQVVWIPDSEFASCYDEFCHQVLWPALHYTVPDAPKTRFFYESASYKQYVSVNQHFADTIIANYEDGDIIWVNDYHLMLVPRMIREKLPNAIIGFFLHVAFPSSEIFRCLSVREPLLRGLLAADLIGFQTANYARHFRHSVSRILSMEALPKGVQTDDRFVDVGVFPMGIDVRLLAEKRKDPEVEEWVQSLKQRYAGMKMIVGRDKLDEVQGVRQKLLAFEMFLNKHPDFRGKVVLIQVALQTTEENELHGGVSDVVSRINSKYSTLTYQPVVFLHTEDLSFSQYLALLTVADAFLVTSLREGMALRTHEFVECQEHTKKPLILSEFTGSYSYSGFRSCIAINPWDSRGTADAIDKALTMDHQEAASRWDDLHHHVVAQNSQAFVTSFLTRCLRTNIEHLRGDAQEVAQFDLGHILPGYKHSERRLLLLDFEGTIWKRDPRARTFDPPEEVYGLLNKLADDPKNEIWVLSGLPVKGAMEILGEKVPKIGIVAENGCFIKTRVTRGAESQWLNMVANFNLSWKSLCMELLNYFTERTPGSFVEEREASVVWRFWCGAPDDESSGDRQWARRQAAEAQNHVFDSLGERYGLRIIPGANSFLVLPNNISRSTAVGAILHPGGPAHSPLVGRAAWMAPEAAETGEIGENDFVLAIGADEKLLRRLNELDHAETCSTSKKGTDAKWRLDPEVVVPTLSQFTTV